MIDALNRPVTRRAFLLGGAAVGTMAAAGGGYVTHLHRAAYFDALTVTPYVLKTPQWPPYLPRLKIAFVSDLHVGCMSVDLDAVGRIVAQINDLKPDVILLGGDYVVGGRAKTAPNYVAPRDIAARLAKLRAPHGVFAVLGNHDWAGDGDAITAALGDVGIFVLENDSAYVPFGEKGFYIVGLADYLSRHPKYRETVADIQNDHPKIVLSHDPYTFKDMPATGVLIQLSGHTHGGQVALPFVGPVVNPTPHAPLKWLYGMVDEGGKRMIVSSGVGTSVLPIKNTPCELVLLTIETATTLTSQSGKAMTG